jgi:hypothetical protein
MKISKVQLRGVVLEELESCKAGDTYVSIADDVMNEVRSDTRAAIKRIPSFAQASETTSRLDAILARRELLDQITATVDLDRLDQKSAFLEAAESYLQDQVPQNLIDIAIDIKQRK